MNLVPGRGFVLATGAAVLMHLLLFAAVQPSDGNDAVAPVPMPPQTQYIPRSEKPNLDENMVRMINSPVVFSLPSDMGFSRELLDNDVQTKKSFLQQVHSEHFLKVVPAAERREEHLHPEQMMVAVSEAGPALPSDTTKNQATRLSTRRVMLAPALRNRLVGGIVLPAELNQPVEKPWEVHATIRVSEQGAIESVFLDHPLKPAALNQQILQLINGLRFKPGKAVESSIEIYSPVADYAEEDAQ